MVKNKFAKSRFIFVQKRSFMNVLSFFLVLEFEKITFSYLLTAAFLCFTYLCSIISSWLSRGWVNEAKR